MITKGKNGYSAEDRMDFDGDYKLTIETHKQAGGGKGLISRASVSLHRDGMMSHAFGLGAGGDYSRRLIVDESVRCTAKTVAAQHANAMARRDDVFAEAKAHYAKFPIPGHRK